MIDFYYTLSAGRVLPDRMPKESCYLLPASSWARFGLCAPVLPEGIRTAADCGGFVATKMWGDYRYTPSQYVDWLNTFTPEWAATMDYCCEDELTEGKPGVVRFRQDRTTKMAHHFWSNYRHAPWAWVPTIQGWHVKDYIEHAETMRPLIAEMHEFYTAMGLPHFRVGIGTLCNRADSDMIRRVVHAVRDTLNLPVKFHLWGVKLRVLQSKNHPPDIASVDSAAWAYSLDRKRQRIARPDIGFGLTQREYDWEIMLPNYQDKVNAALDKTRRQYLL